MEFYSRTGAAVCYLDDGEHIYLWDGRPAGYIAEGKVWAFSGRLLGWFEDGWLYDRKNKPALFSESAAGGPIKPVRKVKPVKGVKRVKPVKGVRQVAHVRPVRSLTWSPVADANYFAQ
ncbi:MAG TPA: hypothetical protein VEA44_10580 [Caulobacter sp.]|nr:hypothetical protein [Caulobacter sp.]